jgi:hypothetical protein
MDYCFHDQGITVIRVLIFWVVDFPAYVENLLPGMLSRICIPPAAVLIALWTKDAFRHNHSWYILYPHC